MADEQNNSPKRRALRVLTEGAYTRVFLPDGTELCGIIGVAVKVADGSDIGTLTLTVCEFTVESSLNPLRPVLSLEKHG